MNLPLAAALLFSWLLAGFIGWRVACGRRPSRVEVSAVTWKGMEATLERMREDARLERVKLAPDELRMMVLDRANLHAQVSALAALCGVEARSPSRDLKAIAEHVKALQEERAAAADPDATRKP